MAFNLKEWNEKRDKEEGKDSLVKEAGEHKAPKINYASSIKQAYSFTGSFSNLKGKSLRDLITRRK